jgi:V/A-type H+-transporting ATPase subunit G/H
MDRTLLKDIKKAEEEAEEIIRNAENKKVTIIEKMRKDSLRFYDNKINELNKKRDKLIEEEEEKIIAKRKNLLENGKSNIDKLKQKAQKNIDKATNYVLEKFMEYRE